MKRVCFVNTTPFWGGGEKWHTENAIAMSERDFDVHFILHSDGEIKDRIKNTSIDYYQVNIGSFSFLNYFTKKQIANYLISKKIDTIIVNDSRDLKTIGLVAKKVGIKRVIYRRGIARPVNATRFNQFIYSRLVSDIIFNSEETKKQFFSNLVEADIKAKQHLLYNGLEIKEYTQNHKSNDKIIIGNASRLTEQKGIEYLIELAQILKKNDVNAEIRIAGKGHLQEQLEEQRKDNGLEDYFKLVGFYDDVHEFLSELDIYVCSSKFEGFGFSIAEAMLHKLPVVGFDISSNPEVIEHEKTGYLVSPFDVEELYQATIKIINSSNLRSELGENGFNKASNQFDREKGFDKLVQILEIDK